MLIDGKDLILGRIATVAAKQALLGEPVHIINCKDVIITGKKKQVLAGFQRRRALGHPKGPFFPRLPERVVKRTIRGMLPYKQPKGRTALKRIMCYRGVPEAFAKQTPTDLKGAHKTKLIKLDYVDLETLAKLLGAKL